MRYNTKFAFLAVAVLCATTFALPLPRDAGSTVARELNNAISAREFSDMYLKARAGDDGDSAQAPPSDPSDPSAPSAPKQGRQRHHHHAKSNLDARENDGDDDGGEVGGEVGKDKGKSGELEKVKGDIGHAVQALDHHHHHHHRR